MKTQFLKHFPGTRKGERGGSEGNVRREATATTAKGAMEKNRHVRVIEGKEIRIDDPVEYFLPTGVGSTF